MGLCGHLALTQFQIIIDLIRITFTSVIVDLMSTKAPWLALLFLSVFLRKLKSTNGCQSALEMRTENQQSKQFETDSYSYKLVHLSPRSFLFAIVHNCITYTPFVNVYNFSLFIIRILSMSNYIINIMYKYNLLCKFKCHNFISFKILKFYMYKLQ